MVTINSTHTVWMNAELLICQCNGQGKLGNVVAEILVSHAVLLEELN